jgi:hypothetical protein
VLKTLGYLVSIVSVILLGITAWDGASDKPALLACLVLGMATSIGGMGLRWASYLREQRQKPKADRDL